MTLFDEPIKKQLRELLQGLKNPVHLVYFTQEFECRACREGRAFVEEIAALNDKISFSVFDFVGDKEEAENYGVDKIPAIVVLDKDRKDRGIRFYGLPAGYEINSFLAALKEVSGAEETLPEALLERIKAIDQDVHIQVFVTPTCPYCPGPVISGHRMALENPHIKADMVDATLFPELSVKYKVMGVPKIVINEVHELMGAQPLPAMLDLIERTQQKKHFV